MLVHTSLCSQPAAAYGCWPRQDRPLSPTMSAAVVGGCAVTVAAVAEVKPAPRRSRSTLDSNQPLPPLPMAALDKFLDLNALHCKAPQQAAVAHCAAKAKATALQQPNGDIRLQSARVQHMQDAVEQWTAGGLDGMAASSLVGYHQQTRPQQAREQRRKPWTPYHDRLLRLLRQRPDLLPAGSTVLVAVSGGQDSMALLRLLSDLTSGMYWPLQLVVAHCNHSIRSDSSANAVFVQQTAQQLGLECHVRTAAQQLRGEDAARKWRLSQLQQIAQQAGCSCYVLGHTATDRAETLLFNLVRGAGAAGLSSMGWEREVLPGLRQVRPLLWMDRTDTAACCEATGMQYWEDSTNYDETFAARNLLRLAVFPLLTGVNAKAVQHIAIASELLEAENQLLCSLARQQLQSAEVTYILQQRLQQHGQPTAATVGQSPAAATTGIQASKLYGEVVAATTIACCDSRPMQRVGLGAPADPCMPADFQPADFKPTVWHRNMFTVSDLVQTAAAEQQNVQLPPAQSSDDAAAAAKATGTALDIQALQKWPGALRSRVIWMWLQQQLNGTPTYSMVQEVLWLLLPRKGNGAKTGTLLDSYCVMRYKLPGSRRQLLVLVQVTDAKQLHEGQLQLQLDTCPSNSRRRVQTAQQRALLQLMWSLD